MTSEERIQKAIDEYIDKTCKTYGLTREEAKEKIWVKFAEEYYREDPPKENPPVGRTELDIGCKGGC